MKPGTNTTLASSGTAASRTAEMIPVNRTYAPIQALVDELAEQGLAVMLISSELEEVVEGADQVVVLKEGAVIDVLRGGDVNVDRLVGALSHG